MVQDAVWVLQLYLTEPSNTIRIFANPIVGMRKLPVDQEGKLIPLVQETNKLTFQPTTKPGPNKPLCNWLPLARKTSKIWPPFYQDTQLRRLRHQTH